MARFGSMQRLRSQGVGDAITHVVTRPRNVAVNEVLIGPPSASSSEPRSCGPATCTGTPPHFRPPTPEPPT